VIVDASDQLKEEEDPVIEVERSLVVSVVVPSLAVQRVMRPKPNKEKGSDLIVEVEEEEEEGVCWWNWRVVGWGRGGTTRSSTRREKKRNRNRLPPQSWCP